MPEPADKDARIERLEQFKETLHKWRAHPQPAFRSKINREKSWVRRELIEVGCFKTYTMQPPPIIGGLIMRNVDLLEYIFDPPWGQSVIPKLSDTIDDAIGRLQMGEPEKINAPAEQVMVEHAIQEGYAFVVMAINPDDATLVDVLDAVKEGAQRCGVVAQRVDEVEHNGRITDRILESIRKAEYVIVDVTHPRPNVFYEAGYAHGIGKLPIFIAKHGTHLEFDLKDYATIFFKSFKELKDSLENRLRALAANKAKPAAGN